MLASAAFASGLTSLGEYELQGVKARQEIFKLDVNPNEDSQWDKYDKSIECGFTHDESLVVFN